MKISVPKILETSKLLGTEAGKQLSDMIDYVSTSSSSLIQALRNGLTYSDNFDVYTSKISLTHNKVQVVSRGPSGRIPSEVRVRRTYSTTTAVSSLVWYMDSSNNLNVIAQFTGSPTAAQSVDIIIYF